MTPVGILVDLTVLLVAAVATVAVRTPDPVRQAVVLSQLGLLLALLFTFLQAPDVALSQLAVGTVVTPLLILLTVRKIRRQGGRDEGAGRRGRGGDR
ncbi:hydrogenase subunit MbhD domain-containing protein [Streptomyces sp. NPDC096033]|uniref:hydrogenase subunit MbhD domain-containing protein n=1 Tax=Streptomyces sp. NPDC096033 TaxID=3366071 RepID=UPI003810FE5E